MKQQDRTQDGLFRSGVKKFDYGPEPDCFYIDLFKKKDEQDKLSYVQTGQVDLVWICFLWRTVTGTEQRVWKIVIG